MRKGSTHPRHEPSGLDPHAGACGGQMCATLRKCGCDDVFSLHPPSRARHSLMSLREICETKIYMALKESVAITISTNVDLAIECLGVRIATIVVKMMKRQFETSEFSNSGCAISGLLATLHGMVFVVLSRSSEYKCSVVIVLVEDL